LTEIHGLIFDVRKPAGGETTVFFKGCPLACWWCHKPESQSPALELMLWESRCVRCGECAPACPLEAIDAAVGVESGARAATDRERCIVCEACMAACSHQARELVGRRVTVAEVIAEVRALGGDSVIFSGGEPLAQPGFLIELLRASKALGLRTTLDTSGYAPWEAFEHVRDLTDLYLYDLKLMDDARHREFTGVPNGLILHNLQALATRGHDVVVRIPIIPAFNDDPENLGMLAAFCASLPQTPRVDLLPYQPADTSKYERLEIPYTMPPTPTPNHLRMAQISAIFADHGLQAHVVDFFTG
jgi:pyruvate formate lyase activating enzyme